MSYIIGVLSAVLWGLTFVFTKNLLVFMNPYEIAFYRHGISGLFYVALLLSLKSKVNLKSINKSDLYKIIAAGFLGMALSPLLICSSMNYISASLAGILNGAIPLITIIGERVFKKTKITPRVSFAIVLSLVGIFLLSGKSDASASPLMGILLVLTGLITWVAFTFINETLFTKYSELELLTYESLIGATMVLPFIVYSTKSINRQVELFQNPTVVINMLILAIGISGIAYLCYMYGLRHLGVAFMSFVMNLLPAFSVISAYIFLSEKLSYMDIVGLVLITISVIVAKKKSKEATVALSTE